VLCCLLVLIVARVGQIQTSEAEVLRPAALEQWTRSYDIPAHRGTLFDRNGNELALSVPAVTVSINPKLVENGAATVQLLDDLLELDDDTTTALLAEISARRRGFMYVARQVEPSIGEQIDALGLAGVNVDDEDRRVMPGGDTGRSVIGRTDIDGRGVSGLELQYDEVLTGTGGTMQRQIAPRGRTVPGTETITEAPVAGHDLVLTLDRSIQFAAEQVLLERVTELGAKGGTAIAMETSTGDIYAMASVRQDDGGEGYSVTNANYAAVDAYEPGSVAKVVTIAGALDQGVVTPETGFEVPWRKQYYDDLLSDSHQHPDEWMSVAQILVESSNIGTIMVQERMNRFVHHEYMRAFGLGVTTGLGFPGESTGILKDADDLWGSERVTVAYGQGLSSTSIQLIAAVNTIANRGEYVTPRLVRATVDPSGELTDAPPAATRQVVSELAAAQTTAMMKDVVCRGTAKSARVDGLSVAGKTGTALKVADDGTYYNEAGDRIYYASFVGFFPAEDPQITVLVSIDEPPAGTDDRFGGTAAAPVFAELVPTLVHETGITPPVGTTGCPETP
jgi:cell division protein FtsI (penicillin-binding protein 3)